MMSAFEFVGVMLGVVPVVEELPVTVDACWRVGHPKLAATILTLSFPLGAPPFRFWFWKGRVFLLFFSLPRLFNPLGPRGTLPGQWRTKSQRLLTTHHSLLAFPQAGYLCASCTFGQALFVSTLGDDGIRPAGNQLKRTGVRMPATRGFGGPTCGVSKKVANLSSGGKFQDACGNP